MVMRSSIFIILLILFLPAAQSGEISELLEYRKAFQAALFEVDVLTQEEAKRLKEQYKEALKRQEKELQEKGDLKGILSLRAEIDTLATEAIPAARPDPDPAAQFREVYLDSLKEIEAGRIEKRKEKAATYETLLAKLVLSLTMAGRVDDALAVQTEIDSLPTIVETSSTGVNGSGNPSEIVRIIQPPKEWPAVATNPFENTPWKESLTVGPGIYRLRNSISIGGHGKGTLVHLAPGGEYSRSEGKFHVWGGRLWAEGCSFREIPFRADHTGGVLFIDCYLSDCTVREDGPWYGKGNYDSIWSFENCRIDGSMVSGGININYFGICMTRCSLSRVELPPIWYRESEPVSRRDDKWLTIEQCRFEKCKVPITFLIATKNCVFIDCRFEDEDREQAFKEPIESVFYTSNSTNAIRKAPATVTLTEKPASALTLPVGSILPEK